MIVGAILAGVGDRVANVPPLVWRNLGTCGALAQR